MIRSLPVRAGLALALAFAWVLSLAPVAAQERITWSDITLADGRVIKASDLAGKTVVVEFWATWCPFCKKQNPYFQRLHEKSAGTGLAVLTFSIDKTPEAVRDYLRSNQYSFPAAMAGAQSDLWFGKRKTLPEVFVVDREGRIVHAEGGEMFEEDVAALARFAPNLRQK
ncbi:MAG: TlpA disulfide reductase family protein [Burkholderiaceae bacterium]